MTAYGPLAEVGPEVRRADDRRVPLGIGGYIGDVLHRDAASERGEPEGRPIRIELRHERGDAAGAAVVRGEIAELDGSAESAADDDRVGGADREAHGIPLGVQLA